MEIEGCFLEFDELFLGFDMYYGTDGEKGDFHCIAIGFLIFQIAFYRYQTSNK